MLSKNNKHIQWINEYNEHHKENETPSPVGPMLESWTFAIYEDQWDATFLRRVEHEDGLINFCKTVENMGTRILYKKITAALAMMILKNTGGKLDTKLFIKEVVKIGQQLSA